MVEFIGYMTIGVCAFWGGLEITSFIIRRIANHQYLYRAYWEYLKNKERETDDR